MLTGLYYKLHAHRRPVAMKKAFIKRRKRVAPVNATQSSTATSEHQSSASISPNPAYAQLPERPFDNHQQSSASLDTNLRAQEVRPNQFPYPRGPPPVDFTLYSASYDTPSRQSPSTVLQNGGHEVIAGSATRNHARSDEMDVDRSEAEPDDEMEQDLPDHDADKVGGLAPDASRAQASAENDRAAKRKRKQDLADKMKQMQAELLELGEDSDA